MTDRTTIPPAAHELSLIWKYAPQNDPGTVRWVRENLARVADALDMLRACGPTFASVRAVVEAWLEATRPIDEAVSGPPPATAQRLHAEWPELTETLDDLVHASRAGRPAQS